MLGTDRRLGWLGSWSSLALVCGLPLLLGACPSDPSCEELRSCGGSEGGTGASGAGGAGGGTGGAGGGTPAECIPETASGPVDDSCGVFVSSSLGDDAGDGTKQNPYATIARAQQDGRNVYLRGEGFSEAVELVAGMSMYGALDCATDWSYTCCKHEWALLLSSAADRASSRSRRVMATSPAICWHAASKCCAWGDWLEAT